MSHYNVIRNAIDVGRLHQIEDCLDWLENQENGETLMLVLSRKQDEKIIISDNITIVVVEILEDRVRLGIEAPKEIPVHRSEVFYKIQRRNKPENTERKP